MMREAEPQGSHPMSTDEFEEFVLRSRRSMVRLAHIVVGSNAVAEELVQDALIRVFERWRRLDSPDAYLRVCVMNSCRSHLRRRRVEQRHEERGRVSIERVSLGSPELDETWAAVLELPFRQRAVLVLRYYEDLTEIETARALNCRLGTVKSAHHRALKMLREVLQ